MLKDDASKSRNTIIRDHDLAMHQRNLGQSRDTSQHVGRCRGTSPRQFGLESIRSATPAPQSASQIRQGGDFEW
ncbi:hypothetical protein CN074_13595 [Sinorhizobium medicae]|nr:hypothetical protein CN201_31075 [Sinorhizobium medicae]RVJ83529.1 hypothetical protein CN168_07260 [Sinorhizobium medicae]RVO82510.1 hypothetical protein CN084_04250 [Sinorhizobium medicae]RVP68326.1 hypothetical protein CN074_13595 [Sinorhizobium medicae]